MIICSNVLIWVISDKKNRSLDSLRRTTVHRKRHASEVPFLVKSLVFHIDRTIMFYSDIAQDQRSLNKEP